MKTFRLIGAVAVVAACTSLAAAKGPGGGKPGGGGWSGGFGGNSGWGGGFGGVTGKPGWGGWPGGSSWGGGRPPHPHHHHPSVIYTDSYYTASYPPAVDYCVPALNPAPVASILLVNPAKNGTALNYRLNGGETRSLAAGYSVEIRQSCTIGFDRGGGAGVAQYALIDGTYSFAPANGVWELFRGAADDSPGTASSGLASNPAPPR